jgi:hypothetical protein
MSDSFSICFSIEIHKPTNYGQYVPLAFKQILFYLITHVYSILNSLSFIYTDISLSKGFSTLLLVTITG